MDSPRLIQSTEDFLCGGKLTWAGICEAFGTLDAATRRGLRLTPKASHMGGTFVVSFRVLAGHAILEPLYPKLWYIAGFY